MKLDQLRDVAGFKWLTPEEMRWNLGIENVRELVADIDAEMLRAVARGRSEGQGQCMNPGDRKMAEARSALGPIGIPDTRGEQEALKSWAVITAHENELAKLRPVLEQHMKAINGQLERIQYLEKQEKHTLAVFDEQRGMIRGLASTLDQVRVTAPAHSELGIELSKIRDMLNALESATDTEVKAWQNMERLFDRVEVLEQRDISPAAEASIAKYQGLNKRLEELEQFRARVGKALTST